ncbi:MAG: AAA family ATPase [Candidatus Caenarcaniphilales bacterium]|nr:AAA family ATPase [Candidatus Caenarcaniphilales bacterium]
MNPKDLIKALESKIEQSPSNQELKERLAFLLLSLGRIAKAESLFGEIIKLNPSSKNALWGLAKINWQKQRFEAAYTYMALLSTLPNVKLTKEQSLTYAKILARKGDFLEAARWMDLAIGMDSSLIQSEMPLLRFIRQNIASQSELNNVVDHHHGAIQSGGNLQVSSQAAGRHFILIEFGTIFPPSIGGRHMLPMQSTGEQINSLDSLDSLDEVQAPITLDQIGGLKKAKQALIENVIFPLKNPQLCSAYFKSTNPRILLYGPSGCGKTMLVQALQTETEISFFQIKASDFMDLSFEECELKLNLLLQLARDQRPSVIWLDEISWLAHQPNITYADHETFFYRTHLLNQLLNQLNNDSKHNGQIALIATTSTPWLLDAKYLNARKIDRFIYINPPNEREKVQILKSIIESKQSALLVPQNINSLKVVSALKNLQTGADFEELIEKAITEVLISSITDQSEADPKFRVKTLNTDWLIEIGRDMLKVPSLEMWMQDAKLYLKPKDSPLHVLWQTMETRR